jgi:lipopolysaccharide export system permease protein
MNLIERYVLKKVTAATALTFVALGAMVWLSQALRQFDLVTANGQTIVTFLQVSALLVPVLVTIVLPVSLMIAVIYTFNSMNIDSELVVINASGAPQASLLKPVMLAGLAATVLVASMTLYFAPLSFRTWQSLTTNVRGNIVTQFMREGTFVSLTPDLTFHMRARNADGSLEGIFVSDNREPDKSVSYLAERGALLDNPLGLFLVMSNGTIQQRNKIDHSISIIEFSSYAFDLSTFSAGSASPTMQPNQRPTEYLFNPDPDDPYFRDFPARFHAELHDRLTAPLYCFLFAMIPLLFLAQAGSARQSRTASIVSAVVLTTVVRAVPVFLPIETSLIAVLATYIVPIGLTIAVAILILAGVQFRPPERIVAFVEMLYARASGLWSGQAAAAAR